MLEIRLLGRHAFGMRFVPRGVLVLFGLSLLRCSVFPDQAPAVGHAQGGSGGANDAGNGGTMAGSGGATAGSGAGTDAEPPASGGSGAGGSAGSGGSAGGGGNTDAGDAATADADGSTRTVAYVASVADCVEAVTQPQQGGCLSFSTLNDGLNELWVDVRRGGRRAFTTYLAFSMDGAIASHTVESVELRMTVTSHPNAPGTGADVSEVTPFDAQSLYRVTPAIIRQLAGTPGPASGSETVVYSLPNDVAKPNAPLYLSLTLPLAGDGTGYWGTNGTTSQPPPTLVISYR